MALGKGYCAIEALEPIGDISGKVLQLRQNAPNENLVPQVSLGPVDVP